MLRLLQKPRNDTENGITLVEIIVVIFIIGIFSVILVADFPTIQKQFALSRATYKLGQDIRKTEDLGLSGVQITDKVKGYGIYFNLQNSPAVKYLIYADIDGNQEFDGNFLTGFCSDDSGEDCIIEIVDISEESKSLYIDRIENIDNPVSGFTSVNFSPPNPTVKISNIINMCQGDLCQYADRIGIVLKLNSDDSLERTVFVNKSGMIEVR
ncbi:MAG: hypothetical protein A2528_02360 [Candidatus Staskawiczbacteria bacterium RIFOXYD2_FULL_37_9]|nr:MAG: hypothetical protein A2581_03480 [Candidatus Staskawiczbacteria bacterium RIFOXYD1_FULL_37_110]OGZ93452.1 MAG: hypothetical protein A2528_02360 [Candidatus Staskawiczbacteria bacterium RIFOXYD2_FULL_37_9]